jgi:hypothetical protein
MLSVFISGTNPHFSVKTGHTRLQEELNGTFIRNVIEQNVAGVPKLQPFTLLVVPISLASI